MTTSSKDTSDTFVQIFNCTPEKFAKLDFTGELSVKCFMKMKKPKVNLGYLDETLRLCYLQNGIPTNKHFLIKIIKKKVIYQSFVKKEFLDIIYNCACDYSIQLRNHWEEDTNLYLVFKDIPKFITLEDKLKSQYVTERTLFTYFNQILTTVSNLHSKQMYGCILGLSSFIYDVGEDKILLTDIGFSKLFPKKKSLNPYKLPNGFDFNEYLPREYLLAKSDSVRTDNLIDDKYDESYDVWQLGILFFIMASENNESPFPHKDSMELYNAISKGSVNWQHLSHRSSMLLQLLQKMLNPETSKRQSIAKIIEYVQNIIKLDKFPDDNTSKKYSISSYLSKASAASPIRQRQSSVSNQVGKVIYPYANSSWGNAASSGYIDNVSEIYEISEIFKAARNEKKMTDVAKEEIEKMCDELKVIITDSKKESKEEANELIAMFKELEFKNESIDSLDSMIKSQKGISEGKYQDMIRHLIFEIKRLKMNLDHEKAKNDKLKKKIDDLENKKKDIQSEYQEKLSFLESKIDVFENVIFPESVNELDNDSYPTLKTKLFTDLIEKSIKSFNDINGKLSEQSAKLLTNIDSTIKQFLIEKESYVKEIIKSKENLINEVIYVLNKNNIDIDSLEEASQKTKNELKLLKESNEQDKAYNELNEKIQKLTMNIKLNNAKHSSTEEVKTNKTLFE